MQKLMDELKMWFWFGDLTDGNRLMAGKCESGGHIEQLARNRSGAYLAGLWRGEQLVFTPE